MREDLIQSAVKFLNDPSVASATLAKRVEFLESKDLTKEEIDEALSRAQSQATSPAPASAVSGQSSVTSSYSSPAPPRYFQPAPPVPERDWKDYFVMATVSVGVAYGLYEVARRYVLPMIMPPTPPALEADKQALDQEFARLEALVEQLCNDTKAVKEAEQERTDAFTNLMTEGREAIDRIKNQSMERRQETRLALATVEQLKEQLPKMLKQYGEQQQQAVVDLNAELKSLKQLVSNRVNRSAVGVPPASSVPSTLPGFVPSKSKANGSTDNGSSNSVSISNDSKPESANGSNGSNSSSSAPSNDFIPVPGGAVESKPAPAEPSIAPPVTTPVAKANGIPAWQLASQNSS